MLGFGAELDSPTCSRARCTEPATWNITWSNPKIHTDGRTKNWLACSEHLEFLREFLAARDFPLDVTALEASP